MMLVEPGAVDLHHQLRTRLVQRVALELLDRVAEHLAIEMPRPWATLEACQRRLMRCAPGADHQSAAARARENPCESGSLARRTTILAVTLGATWISSSNSTGRSGSGSGAGR